MLKRLPQAFDVLSNVVIDVVLLAWVLEDTTINPRIHVAQAGLRDSYALCQAIVALEAQVFETVAERCSHSLPTNCAESHLHKCVLWLTRRHHASWRWATWLNRRPASWASLGTLRSCRGLGSLS